MWSGSGTTTCWYKKEYKKNDPSTWSPTIFGYGGHVPRFPLYFDTTIHVVGAGLVDAEICTVAEQGHFNGGEGGQYF
jgi:hypothetical protein